jgi:hypothetical protein
MAMIRPRSQGARSRKRAGRARRSGDVDKRLRHPAFPQPDRTDRAVWHYMSLAKFIALLDTRALFFCRLDRLGDEYEGSLPRRWRRELQAPPTEAAKAERLRLSCHVNCWNMSEHENEALWRLYGAQDASIGIRSTYDELVHVLSQNHGVFLGLINYVDYDYREGSDAVRSRPGDAQATRLQAQGRSALRQGGRPLPAQQGGLAWRTTWARHPIELDRLVQGIYIDPYAPRWFEKVVKAVVRQFAPSLSERISWSSMKADPLY